MCRAAAVVGGVGSVGNSAELSTLPMPHKDQHKATKWVEKWSLGEHGLSVHTVGGEMGLRA